MKLAGWGNYPWVETVARSFRGDPAVLDGANSLIARGNGRAYGDAAVSHHLTVSMLAHDRLLAFEPETGRLTCEAGALLSDIVAAFLPRGWFAPVTPGTRLVTVGGMIAADVHGKNHHVAGSFGRHVESLRLLRADGSVTECRRGEPLFRATVGGMGLTGIILNATFRMQRVETAYIRQQTVAAANLDAVMAAFEESAGWTHSVAWIDCLAGGAALGRSLLY
ncbi:MAG: FAD-binding oxidoreductase, partial [Alphaproteobacteria bacterium]|nr:FAD-binding oxidoreductase [Alphaproteobacteria bacterium]